MKHCNNLRQILRTAFAVAAIGVLTLTGCTKVDDTLGSNLIPDNQQMLAGFTTFPLKGELNPRKYVETRLYQTDSIVSSNLNYGYMGSALSDTLGLRSAGFLTQFTSYYRVDSGYFGFRPIFDSAQLMISINDYEGDTTRATKFAVYEVISNKYITEKAVRPGKTARDTVFYINFDPEHPGAGAEPILGEKLFTFELGGTDASGKANPGPSAAAVTLKPEPAGEEYVRRLMLQSGEYKGRYGIYKADSLAKWVEAFKGVYIKPEAEETVPGKGAIYSTSLDATGLAVFGRNRRKEDPTLIKDTIGLAFFFYDSSQSIGKVSINSVKHDYARATSPMKINIDDARETNPNRPENPRAYISGMGGVVTQMTFAQEFFSSLVNELKEVNAKTHRGFKSFAFSQVKMSVYFNDSNYDWTQSPQNPDNWIREMSAAPSRIGMYTKYNTLTPIVDYNFYAEQVSGTALAYDGSVNRSRGCYVMDITGYAQQLWNSFLKESEHAKDAEGNIIWEKIDWSKVEKRSVYLGPEAYDLFTAEFSVLQGASTQPGAPVVNNAPIRFELTYNMIK